MRDAALQTWHIAPVKNCFSFRLFCSCFLMSVPHPLSLPFSPSNQTAPLLISTDRVTNLSGEYGSVGRCGGGVKKVCRFTQQSVALERDRLRGQETESDQPFVFCVFQSDILWIKSTKTMRSKKNFPCNQPNQGLLQLTTLMMVFLFWSTCKESVEVMNDHENTTVL